MFNDKLPSDNSSLSSLVVLIGKPLCVQTISAGGSGVLCRDTENWTCSPRPRCWTTSESECTLGVAEERQQQKHHKISLINVAANGMVCRDVLCCAVLCCAVLCCAVLCCAVLCCAVLCCVVMCCVGYGVVRLSYCLVYSLLKVKRINELQVTL